MNYFNSDSYYIFGAGNTAKMVRSILEKNGKKTMSFLTSQIVSKDIDSIPVVNLSDGNKKLDHKIPVIIGVFNREANASMNFITEYLKKKFENIISFFDFYHYIGLQIKNIILIIFQTICWLKNCLKKNLALTYTAIYYVFCRISISVI